MLAISGLHIGLIAATVYSTLRWVLARSEMFLLHFNLPKVATAATLPPVVAYATIAGASAATLRATIMAMLFISALLIDRARYWPAAMAAASIGVCTVTPGAIFEASFQLTFTAVIIIIIGVPPLRARYDTWAERRLVRLRSTRLANLERWFVLSITVTALALMATAPLTLYHFQQLSLVGLVSNIFIVPITGMAAVSVGLLAVLITPQAPEVGALCFAVCGTFLQLGDHLTSVFSTLPFSDINLPTPSKIEIAVYYALLLTPVVQDKRVRRFAVVATAFAMALLGSAWIAERFHSGALRMTFISVGQGDSTLIEFPAGHTMLVDGGGLSATFDTGERILAPLLRRQKIRTVDTLVITHPDYDHYAGLAHIADEFNVAEIWSSGARGQGTRYRAFRQRIDHSTAVQHVVKRGFEKTIDGVSIQVLHPAEIHSPENNDTSIVLRLSYAGSSILLSGDIESGGEYAVLKTGSDLRSAILKVPHHGSASSSTTAFLKAVAPCWAVVSSGYRNRYGMPHREVVNRYEKLGVDLLRTDTMGAIEIRIEANGSMRITHGRRHRITTRYAKDACHNDNRINRFFALDPSNARALLPALRLTGREAPA